MECYLFCLLFEKTHATAGVAIGEGVCYR